ncbi:MAG TPA: hypothetical protein VFG87_12540 [Amycolatopsis sp.]|nr:hypothetical protein [Amycolatopsis sp.]
MTLQLRPPRVHVPRVQIPAPRVSREELDVAVKTAQSYLPPTREIAYYGGLALMAVFDLIEWPVAAAMGLGTVILRTRRDDEASRSARARPARTAGQREKRTAAE